MISVHIDDRANPVEYVVSLKIMIRSLIFALKISYDDEPILEHYKKSQFVNVVLKKMDT